MEYASDALEELAKAGPRREIPLEAPNIAPPFKWTLWLLKMFWWGMALLGIYFLIGAEPVGTLVMIGFLFLSWQIRELRGELQRTRQLVMRMQISQPLHHREDIDIVEKGPSHSTLER